MLWTVNIVAECRETCNFMPILSCWPDWPIVRGSIRLRHQLRARFTTIDIAQRSLSRCNCDSVLLRTTSILFFHFPMVTSYVLHLLIFTAASNSFPFQLVCYFQIYNPSIHTWPHLRSRSISIVRWVYPCHVATAKASTEKPSTSNTTYAYQSLKFYIYLLLSIITCYVP